MDIFLPTERSPRDCPDLGAAVGTPTSPDQRHIGLLYTDEQEQVRFLHLAWHCILKDEEAPESGYVWVESGLDPTNQMVMSQYCQLIAEKHQCGGIPYGLFYSGELLFDPTTGAWTGPQDQGLTCASFILSIHKAQGFSLIEFREWPERSEDLAWGEKILKMLGGRASPAHLEAQRTRLQQGLVRFRPAEVASAVASSPPPIGFDAASQLAAQILASVQRYRQP